MKLKFFKIIFALIILSLFNPSESSYSAIQIQELKIDINGTSRDYLLFNPRNLKKVPVVIALHGGGGNAKQLSRYISLNEIAFKNNFIVVYPQGIGMMVAMIQKVQCPMISLSLAIGLTQI